ncbi:indolepyruvate ferredoxin oxidoreductase [Phenylobacterium sp. Root77]|uniref:indolepyruvate ferredoxin oxidoreductase family protein n=1 Tax=unclassified Phenylobacterium TaxID=2640670 RepID=UPI0006FE7883|nr:MULTISPECIES: indolepyruvate ferredoxin oxidoreductase family protein [unclassified Phenylobacterium]KQW72965.1 indolepyruvate ferredoxin oxidoreductase [Phenylobacterium sp. Root1277]KQW92184.1 indolepyruvate ferredoxin oxidoreductase [Phenylobacterium sp. Root1290]KRC40415.1 indolepyruvate ferredoxin oxidoreductase [Phenylobacterium sp. Root77]
MRHADVTLDDKFLLTEGRVFITGVQALLRVMMDQHRLDKAAGLNTAGFVSGYRGSPLGGLDQQAHRAGKFLKEAEVVFKEGLNEDLAATAVWGSQQANLFPGAKFDGVTGMWYGKAPGVDRTGDAFKHANFAGTWSKGGVLAVAGDDHTCKSSTLPSQSEFAFQDFEMPVLSPADVQEVLDYGLMGIAMSRFSGLWVGLIALADTMDSGVTIDVSVNRHQIVVPTNFNMPAGGLGIRLKDQPLEKERRLRNFKIPAALAFARANRLDRVMLGSSRPRLGIVCQGQAYKDVIEALAAMGISSKQASDLGVAIYKVGMPWPLEPTGLRSFAAGLETLMVIEHKRPLIETQARAALYDLPAHARPKIVGKVDEQGHPLLSTLGSLSVAEVALAIADRLPPGPHMERVHDYLSRVSAASVAAVTLAADQQRKPFFCSGCPHNTSTRLPEGTRALAGIGCHYMASFNDPQTDLNSHMGGEGLTWVGSAPFTTEPHVFVNLGDGTYNHSGSLAIRASVAASSHVTYKLLFNDAVAMTGGQPAESGFTPAQITRQLASEGVAKTVIVADDPSRYEGATDLAPGVEVKPRSELMAVQKMLRETPGTTVLLYDQVCATEKRRRRKRGSMEVATKRVFINPLVCEGCGDCSKKSNCVSVEPLNTEFGRKRKINQSTCNTDYSCLDGFCPSFVTIEGGENAQAKTMPALTADSTPLPTFEPLEGVRNIVFTGIGGTGVTTVASILAMAAHVDGRASSVVDMTGLAQKGGAVFSHVRIGETEDTVVGGRVPAASAHVLIACDILSAAGADALALYAKDRTVAVGNEDFAPTADFVTDRDVRFDSGAMSRRIKAASKAYDECPAHHLAETTFGDAIYANMIMVGFAWQKGLIPLSSRAVYRAIRLNGVQAEANLQAFELGRRVAHDPSLARAAEEHTPTPETMPLDELIAHRTRELTAYQNAAYAKRYADTVAKVAAAEAPLGADALTRAVAVNLYKLMAYKDEYEVARLYTDGRFAAERGKTFKGGKAKILLSPPLIAPKGPDGKPKKIEFGGWMLETAFPIMARMKSLRGGPLDIFGRTEERRMERGLIAEYEAGLDKLLPGLDAGRLALATQIAQVPQAIRGFGHIKEASVKVAKADEAKLWAKWEAATA